MGDVVDHYKCFRLLATAIAGEPVSLAHLLQVGARSYSEGERIYLSRQSEFEDLRLELIVQAVLIAGRSFGSKEMRAILGRPELRERYLLLEVLRCSRLIEERLPSSFLEKLKPFQTKHSPQTSQESLKIARSRCLLPHPPRWFGTLRPWRILRALQTPEGGRLSERKLEELESKLKSISQDSDERDDEDSITKTSFWKWFTSPIGRDNFLSRFMSEVLDMKSSPDKDLMRSGASISSEMVSGRVSQRVTDIASAIRSTIKLVLSPSFAQYESDADSYPEWDCSDNRYRPNWTSVEEVNPANEDEQLAASTLKTGGDRAFQRALAKLCLGLERHRGLRQGDDLVLDKVIRLAIDLRSRHSGDERVYSANLKTCRDLGIQILLDVSSSTLERSSDGHRVIDLQAQAAYRVCRAFGLLGNRVAMHGFHSWGRGRVRLQTLKSFDEPVGQVLESRMRRLLVAGYTRCGAAIRHATKRLEKQADTPFKLLLLISDGFPYDDEYEEEYAASDTRKAIEEARARGVAVACLSVGSDADAHRLEQVYGASNYIAVNRVEQLPPKLGYLIRSAIANATGSQNRMTHRTGKSVARNERHSALVTKTCTDVAVPATLPECNLASAAVDLKP